MMELAGTEGVLVSGGALTGKSVQFFDLESKRCVINSLFIPNLDNTIPIYAIRFHLNVNIFSTIFK